MALKGVPTRYDPKKTLAHVLAPKTRRRASQEPDTRTLGLLEGDNYERMALAYYEVAHRVPNMDAREVLLLALLLRMVERRARVRAKGTKWRDMTTRDVRWVATFDETLQHAYDFEGRRFCAPNIVLASPEHWERVKVQAGLSHCKRCRDIERMFEGS